MAGHGGEVEGHSGRPPMARQAMVAWEMGG